MTCSTAISQTAIGVEGELVEVEARVSGREHGATIIVGLPDRAVTEARERVRAGVIASELWWPQGRVVLNLAPGNVPKLGPRHDLAMAVAILAASDQLPRERAGRVLVLGELAFDGRLRPVHGALIAAETARRVGLDALVCPSACASEAALVSGLPVYGARHLTEVVAWLRGELELPQAKPVRGGVPQDAPDLADVRGQPLARRALELAAVGGHNLLMVGPPGVGKTMLARRLPGLLPALDEQTALEVTRVHSAAGVLRPGSGAIRRPPFRAPHHGASAPALVGGGPGPRPGEISLATGGVLFLDELTEFSRSALEALRQPLEDGELVVARAAGRVRFPARVQLVAAANPCPCGGLGGCTCTNERVERYRARLSGPLVDRLDLVVRVDAPDPEALSRDRPEATRVVAARVVAARDWQAARGQASPNARLELAELERLGIAPGARELLERAAGSQRLSARRQVRVLRLARSAADLASSGGIGREHVAEALALIPRAPGARLTPVVRILERGAADWPACLSHLGAGEPRRLHVRGPLALTAACAPPAVAMVGARAASAAGERFTRTLARELAEAGVSVISGLALGIDASAHAGALDGNGRTVAVLGCGIDHDYPRRNAALAARIAATGAIISEWGPGVEPAPWRFPVRNRIVAALAQATVVVEATRRSGALITADHALAIGRDVLAVPGAPWLELGGGTLALLRAGAAPVGSAADVLDALGVQMELPPARLEPPSGVGGVLWAELRRRPRRRDALALATGLAADIATAALAELELDGLVVEERDGTMSALEPGRTRPVNSRSEGA